jgi:hypothetical protein
MPRSRGGEVEGLEEVASRHSHARVEGGAEEHDQASGARGRGDVRDISAIPGGSLAFIPDLTGRLAPRRSR